MKGFILAFANNTISKHESIFQQVAIEINVQVDIYVPLHRLNQDTATGKKKALILV